MPTDQIVRNMARRFDGSPYYKPTCYLLTIHPCLYFFLMPTFNSRSTTTLLALMLRWLLGCRTWRDCVCRWLWRLCSNSMRDWSTASVWRRLRDCLRSRQVIVFINVYMEWFCRRRRRPSLYCLVQLDENILELRSV